MRNLLLFACLLFILSACAKPDPKAEEVNAEAAIKRFYTAIENFDYEAMRTVCTKDFHAIEDGYVFNNLNEWLASIKSFEGSKGQIKIDFPQTEVSGDVALSIVKFDAANIPESCVVLSRRIFPVFDISSTSLSDIGETP